jgi:hypothetical protein
MIRVLELGGKFTNEDVVRAISSLKSDKSAGVDLLIPEIFIHCKNISASALCKLFNHIFETGEYPESWCKGIIVPVPKTGDYNDVNNYRAITLTSVFQNYFQLLVC